MGAHIPVSAASAAGGGQPAITALGPPGAAGTYLLRLRVAAAVAVQYGRFSSAPITTLPGDVVYLGSALGQHGAATLARRLLRHATRAAPGAPHPIRDDLAAFFAAAPPAAKRLRWHVDYLLQETAVTLTHVLIIRGPARLEGALGAWLAAQPHLHPIAPGLGASDHPGHSHLLHTSLSLAAWWAQLPAGLSSQFPEI